MIVALSLWREIIIVLLVVFCGVLGLKLQNAQYQAKETQLIHEKLIADQKRANAELVAKINEERKIESEVYAIEINRINGLYADLVKRNGRMHTEIKTYTDRLHTFSRETLENNAKTCGILYGELRTEIVGLGRYTAEIDAELDKITKSPN